ncbi:MAG TPA: glycosyl hydrolase family 8 [Longimicrobium sp.]|nr:glycosyl hydrolase family 8 [Longimicrobium sp.]
MTRSSLAPLVLAAALAACTDDPTSARPPDRSAAPPGGALAALSTAGAAPYAYACGVSVAASQAAANEQLRAKYEAWRAARVSYEGTRARVKASGNFSFVQGGVTYPLPYGTISEGHAYGMLLAAYMGDKKTFDAMEAYRSAYLNRNGVMPWVISQDGVVADSGAATDADEDMALALLVAHRRWGGYATPLSALLTAIRTHMVEPAGSAHAYLLRPADMPLSWWPVSFPSYHAPAWYKAFASYTGDGFWTQVANKSYQYLASIDAVAAYANGATGLLPDRTKPDGSLDNDSLNHRFSWDAIRAPWRLAADAAWSCDTRAKGRIDKMNGFFSGSGPGQGPLAIGSIYRTNGDFLDDDLYGGPDRDAWFYGPLTSAALHSGNATYRQAMWNEAAGLTTFAGYGDELGLLGMLLAGGGMYDPYVPRRAWLDDMETGGSRWWPYADAATGSTLTRSLVSPGATGQGLRVTYSVVSWAGLGTNVNQDWSGYRALEFWIQGSGTGNTIDVEIEDADGELFAHRFVDDFTGWRFASVPLTVAGFPRRTDWQPVTVNNGLTLTNVKILRFRPLSGSGSFALDRVILVP